MKRDFDLQAGGNRKPGGSKFFEVQGDDQEQKEGKIDRNEKTRSPKAKLVNPPIRPGVQT